jgi:formamidopyrimidine-DNA glycosylase
MPELPELEVICEVLNRRVGGRTLTAVKVIPPGGIIVVRDLTGRGFELAMTDRKIGLIRRRGKFLIFSCEQDDYPQTLLMIINPKLSGQLQLTESTEKVLKKTHITFTLRDGQELRYIDRKQMGQVYLTNILEKVPDYASLGPEPFDLTLEEFRGRLKGRHGEIKGILTNGQVVAGIGNAYADEILWAAMLHPYRKRSQLTGEEEDRLYAAMQSTMAEAIEKVRERMQENIHLEQRDFMAVHMKAGLPCPRCGNRISEVSANQRITNFCRTCQPGGLIKGMG